MHFLHYGNFVEASYTSPCGHYMNFFIKKDKSYYTLLLNRDFLEQLNLHSEEEISLEKIQIILEELFLDKQYHWCHKIKAISIQGYKMQAPITNLFYFSSLVSLSLSHSGIKCLSQEIFKLKNLESLDLSYNNLPQVPSNISYIWTLRDLNIYSNPIGIDNLMPLALIEKVTLEEKVTTVSHQRIIELFKQECLRVEELCLENTFFFSDYHEKKTLGAASISHFFDIAIFTRLISKNLLTFKAIDTLENKLEQEIQSLDRFNISDLKVLHQRALATKEQGSSQSFNPECVTPVRNIDEPIMPKNTKKAEKESSKTFMLSVSEASEGKKNVKYRLTRYKSM